MRDHRRFHRRVAVAGALLHTRSCRTRKWGTGWGKTENLLGSAVAEGEGWFSEPGPGLRAPSGSYRGKLH